MKLPVIAPSTIINSVLLTAGLYNAVPVTYYYL